MLFSPYESNLWKWNPSLSWRIEHTSHPWFKKRRREELEKEVPKHIDQIKRLLKVQSEDGFMVGGSDFSVEALWVGRAQKTKPTSKP
jgi:hypothetical protein